MLACMHYRELRAKDIARVQDHVDDLDNKEKRQKLTKDQKEEQESGRKILEHLQGGQDVRYWDDIWQHCLAIWTSMSCMARLIIKCPTVLATACAVGILICLQPS